MIKKRKKFFQNFIHYSTQKLTQNKSIGYPESWKRYLRLNRTVIQLFSKRLLIIKGFCSIFKMYKNKNSFNYQLFHHAYYNLWTTSYYTKPLRKQLRDNAFNCKYLFQFSGCSIGLLFKQVTIQSNAWHFCYLWYMVCQRMFTKYVHTSLDVNSVYFKL